MSLLESVHKLRSQGRLPQALRLLESAVPEERGKGPVLAALAEMRLYARNPSGALDCAALARGAGQDDSPALLHIQALASRAMGSEEDARSYAAKILASDPGHRGAKDLLLILDGKSVRPETQEKILRLRAKKSPLRISIRSPSEREPDPALRRLWGDHWVKEELSLEFSRLGLLITNRSPDIVLHLFGSPPKSLPDGAYHMVWLYSHPDMVTLQNLRLFDKISCAAVNFMPKLDSFGYLNVDSMPACTSKTPFRAEPALDLIFLGNARKSRPDGRGVVADMRATGLDFKVWGNLWDELLPPGNYGGPCWDYERLEELYASARITLNDHHPDMAREGFVSNKAFDILASGGFVISDANAGLEAIFGDSVPQYETPEQLRDLARFYLDAPAQREALRRRGQKIALSYTYRKCVQQFLNGLQEQA